MSAVFKCDRCGEIFEAKINKFNFSPYFESNHVQTMNINLSGETNQYNGDYDLCPSCMAALNNWLKGNTDGKV